MAQNIKSGITYKEYNEKYRLPEQERDERLIMKHKHHILCYEPGKGKSYPVIHCIRLINRLKGGNANVLILSDATCIKNMWKAEIVPQCVLPKNTYMVTDRTAIGDIQSALLETKWDVIVCDECQSLRSGVTRAKSKYAKLVYRLCSKAEYVIGMTGTIAGNNNIEPFCVLHNLHVAGMGNIRCIDFKRTYCINELQYGPFGSFEKPVKLNVSGEALMKKAYREGCSFWDYDDNDDMPPMNIEMKSFNVPITEEYSNALDGILKCGEFESTMIKSIAMQKAQQALNGFIYYDVPDGDNLKRQILQIQNFDNPKIKYIVDECKKGLKIITYRFQEDGNSIKNALLKNNLKYSEEIQDFKDRASRGEHLALVIQCARGKAANIQVCKDIIYYTADFSFINYKQMIHRCWRRGQTEKCNVTFLINTTGDEYKIEEKIWKALCRKKNIHELLMSIKNKEE